MSSGLDWTRESATVTFGAEGSGFCPPGFGLVPLDAGVTGSAGFEGAGLSFFFGGADSGSRRRRRKSEVIALVIEGAP